MKKKWAGLMGYVAGVLTAVAVFLAAQPGFAASISKTIQVFTGVSIWVDDVLLDTKDANGNPVEAFIYNGTTYLPVRAVSEAVGKTVQWEGKTKSVYLGKHGGEKDTDEPTTMEAEEKKGYNTGITYSNLARNPDDYIGKKVKFIGEVFQVLEGDGIVEIRLGTKSNGYGYVDDVLYIYYDASIVSSRILEGDIITIYGVSEGLYTYQSVRGDPITIPLVQVDKIDTPF